MADVDAGASGDAVADPEFEAVADAVDVTVGVGDSTDPHPLKSAAQQPSARAGNCPRTDERLDG